MSSPGQSLREVARPVLFGVFEFHPATLELKRSGHKVRLQDLPARLLAALLRNPGELVTREQLQAELWQSNTFVQFDAGLNTAMNKLRLALRDSAENPQFIETVPRTGYRFIAPVRQAEMRFTTLQPLEQRVAEPRESPEPAQVEGLPAPQPPAPRSRRWLWPAIAAAAALGISAATLAPLVTARHAGYGQTVRFAIDLPLGQEFKFYAGRQIAISPDGAVLAWIAASGGVRQIYVRKLAESAFRPLPGTARASSLCFSPASDWVAYIAETGELRKVSADGRWNLKLLTLGPRSTEGTVLWGSDGWIYFSATDYPPALEKAPDSRKIFRVRAEGGKPEDVQPGPQPAGAWYPQQLLAHGLLCTTDYAPTDLAINYLRPADSQPHEVMGHASGPRVLPSGHLIFDRSSNLMAVPFDEGRMEAKGAPAMVIPDIAPDRYAGLQMDISNTGTLVYFRSTLVHEREPVWVDKDGRETPSGLPAGRYRLLDISPGGDLLLTRYDAGDHWTISSYRPGDGTWKDIHADDSPNSGAIWGPDEKSIVIAARYQRERFDTLYLQPLDSNAAGRPLLPDAYSGKYPQSYSRAANAVAYTEGYHEKTKRDIYVLPLTAGAQPQCVACTVEDDIFPSFSPDGKWLTYSSAMSGRFEIYAQRYPGPFKPIQVSTEGGRNSLWARSGREIYYGSGDAMWAVDFDPASGRSGHPHKLFSGHYDAGSNLWNRDMLLSADGQRFLMLKVKDDPADYRRIQVVLNWFGELQRTVPNR
jgi:DNA-binding winged helix-turn-helix (wHTH) protein/Tol biopolymer transport system component